MSLFALCAADLGALLGHPGVAVVDCCAPTGDHARIAQAALQAGKALFCEKPLAANAEEATQIAALARDLEHRELALQLAECDRSAAAHRHRLIGDRYAT